jgi:hypothetical protein
MKKVTIDGDSAALLERQSAHVSEWNKTLDRQYPATR